MTPEIVAVLTAFSPEFSRPTWKNIQILLIGAILCRGPRRVSSILRVMGLSSIRNFSKYHRVLSRAEWSGLALAKILLDLLINLLPASWPIVIATQRQKDQSKRCLSGCCSLQSIPRCYQFWIKVEMHDPYCSLILV